MNLLKKTTCTLAASAALAALAPLPALAANPIAPGCAPGQPFIWDTTSPIPFNPDQGDLGPVNNADATALVQLAFDTWGAVPSSSATYANAGQLPVDVDITNFGPFLNPAAPDGLSAIVFDDTGEIFDLLFGPGSGILGFAGPEWVNTVECTIFEGVSFLNGPSFSDAVAALDVSVHEFGHYSGLGHTVVNGEVFSASTADQPGPTPFDPEYATLPVFDNLETMYPFYFGPGSGTANLAKDDIVSLSTLYPAEPLSDVTGTILAANGVTEVVGVNVIARNEADPWADAVSGISGAYDEDGRYLLPGLTPGADYRVYIDGILAGGFSSPLAQPLPGPEEYYNVGESNNIDSPDAPEEFSFVQAGATDIDVIFNIPAPGDPLQVGEDGNVELPLPFAFGICGQSFDSVFVHANGFLTFGSPDTSFFNFIPSVPVFLSAQPRIAPLWDDLSPFNLFTGAPQGTVSYDVRGNRFIITYDGVPTFPDVGSNTFSVTLYGNSDDDDSSSDDDDSSGGMGHSDGNRFRFDYDGLDTPNGLVGYSCGGAITTGLEEETDLTRERRNIKTKNRAAVFEEFADGDNDLSDRRLKFQKTRAFKDKFEDNDTAEDAAHVRLPFDTLEVRDFSDISPLGDDVDWYAFDAEAGSILVAEVVAGANVDSYIGLFQLIYENDDDDSDSNGRGRGRGRDDDDSSDDDSSDDRDRGRLVDVVEVAVDDDGGVGLLSRIATIVSESGTYAIAVTTFPDADFSGDGGSAGRYVLTIEEADSLTLALGDDDAQEVPLGFDFSFNGVSYDSVWVNSNGSLSFGAGSTSFFASVSGLLNGPPRISPLWTDLSPNQAGTVEVTFDAGSATVSFTDVTEFLAGNANTFSVTLDASGVFTVDYGNVDAFGAIVGTTEGNGAADPGATDLSAAGILSASGTTYEDFFFTGPFDLAGSALQYDP